MREKRKTRTAEEKLEIITKGVKWTLGGLAILAVGYLGGRISTFKEMGPLLDDEKVDRYLGVSDSNEGCEEEA